jgi:A/G-specific adenine glycosylase
MDARRDIRFFPGMRKQPIAKRLLDWYEVHARTLPWRVGPKDRAAGIRPDPFHVLLSEVMLQQTTVAAVAPRYRRFVERWPNAAALTTSPIEDLLAEWAGLGYYARARNLHRCAEEIVSRHGGVVPDTEEQLRTLPGIGLYTAASIAAIAFDRRAVVVDGNVERVVARLFAIDEPLPGAKARIREKAEKVWPAKRGGEFAEALMDLGSAICTPKSPNCGECPLEALCAAASAGAAETYPRRSARPERPLRRGAALALFDARGRVLLERRPAKGLLGGMLGLPGTDWRAGEPDTSTWPRSAAPAGAVTHVFTHFRLELDVFAGRDDSRSLKENEEWADPMTVRLPTVMRKALDVALSRRERL